MIVRALDSNNDWTFGASLNNYKSANLAVQQNIQTRLSSFIGNCFFDMGAGINWFGFLGSKGSNNNIQLSLAISAVILNTTDVLGLLQLSFNINSSRQFSISYQVQTSYSVTGSSFIYDLGGSN
jgi:hypothetical protein